MNFYIEIIATIFGLIQGILVMLNKRSNWIFYILHITMLFVFSCINNLYGDMTNNIIYLGMGIYGAFLWSNKNKSHKITECTKKEKYKYTAVIAFGTIFIGLLLKHTSDPLPFLDAFSTVSSFVATWYMVKKKLDAWIIWIINDLVYVVEYALLPDIAYWLIGLNLIWTAMAIASYKNWKQIMKKEII